MAISKAMQEVQKLGEAIQKFRNNEITRDELDQITKNSDSRLKQIKRELNDLKKEIKDKK